MTSSRAGMRGKNTLRTKRRRNVCYVAALVVKRPRVLVCCEQGDPRVSLTVHKLISEQYSTNMMYEVNSHEVRPLVVRGMPL